MAEPVQNERLEEDCMDCQLDIGITTLLGLCPALSEEVTGLDCQQLSEQVNEGKLDFDGLLKRIRKATGGRHRETFDHIEELVKTPLKPQGE